MSFFTVTFSPQNKKVKVKKGTTLLEAASELNIKINNLCGGDGICKRCKMVILKGDVCKENSASLIDDEIKKGFVLSCMTKVEDDLVVKIPEGTQVEEIDISGKSTKYFRNQIIELSKNKFKASPLLQKVYLQMQKPTLINNTADHQRVCEKITRVLDIKSVKMDYKIIKTLPEILRKKNYCVTATVGYRKDFFEVLYVEGGNTSCNNYMVIVDIGTTTIVAYLIDINSFDIIDIDSCFNSQCIYGGEVTRRIIAAEKRGVKELQKFLVEDINTLIQKLVKNNNIKIKDVNGVVCSGNTIMEHFLLGLPVENIRRSPYIPSTIDPPVLPAAELGIHINPYGLLFTLPCISGWVGSDITAGILATEIYTKKEVCLLMDIGTNGEIVVGNRDWLVACSSSAGPALEGASVECGMRAEIGAIERVYIKNKEISYKTIGNSPAKGICGSGIIDLVSVLLKEGIINRSGNFNEKKMDKFKLNEEIFITEVDIENIITAKAAIFAAKKILLAQLNLKFSDISHFYIAGAFGNYINIKSAISIGLIPNIPENKIEFVGNTSIKGATLAALYREAFSKIMEIGKNTTYYDLMGAKNYVEEFKKAMFLPHTNIEEF